MISTALFRVSALWSRNPLVRVVDRVEALTTVVLFTVALSFLAVAGAIGTSQYDSRSRTYAAEAHTSHTVTATAVEDSAVIVEPNTVVTVTTARWDANGRNHVGEVRSPDRLKAGDHFTIWVDAAGNRIVGPPSPSRAANEATAIAVSAWVAVATAAATLAYRVHRTLDRRRFTHWDRELAAAVGDDGNRRHPHS